MLKKRDIVKIVKNIPQQYIDKPKPILGEVSNVDGYYVTVKFQNPKFEMEFLAKEVEFYRENMFITKGDSDFVELPVKCCDVCTCGKKEP